MALVSIPCFLSLPVRVPIYTDIQREAAHGRFLFCRVSPKGAGDKKSQESLKESSISLVKMKVDRICIRDPKVRREKILLFSRASDQQDGVCYVQL